MKVPEITASKLERLALCPGSLMAERGMPERTSPEATEGQKIHAALAAYWNGNNDLTVARTLSEDQQAIVIAYITHAQLVIEQRFGLQIWPQSRVLVEQRMTAPDGFSGQPDLVLLRFSEDVRQALVFDWKTGWIEQEASQSNLQLRAYAVLVGLTHQVSTVEVVLLQRNAPALVTRYEMGDLLQALEEIREIMREAGAPGAIRIAGEKQCRYCRAIGICPEARAMISQVLAAVDPKVSQLPLDAEPETVDMLLQCLDGKQLAYIRERKKVAELVLACTDAEIRRRLQDDPDSVPGWALRPGNRVRKITNAQKAFELLDGLVSGSQFASCCTVSIGSLEAAVQSTHETTAAKAKQAIAECLAPVIEEHLNQPSIVRAK